MAYAAYPNYKPSGIAALGDVPQAWIPKRLRFALKTNPSSREIKLTSEASVSFVIMDAVGENGGIRLDEEKELGEIGSGYTYFADNDVVVAKITPCFENGKGAIAKGLTNGIAFGTTELHVLRVAPELDADFLFYLTISPFFRNLGEAEMYGAGGQKRVPEDFIKDFRIALPSVKEQGIIARFLDHKTTQIDTLIAKKEALLVRLAEKRTALISHAVTKGLDPTVPMKDSGVAWLGAIPIGWKSTKVKFIGELILGLTYSPADVVSNGSGTLVLRSSNVQGGNIALQDKVYVNAEIPKKLRTRLGDILICSRNGSRALIGKCALIDEHSAGQTFGAFMTVLRTKHSNFLYYVLNSSLFKYQSSRFLTATINQLTTETLGGFEIALPSEEEQKKIVNYLNQKTGAIDLQITKANLAILKLKEYRAALITNAVTGKIDVRNFPIPEHVGWALIPCPPL